MGVSILNATFGDNIARRDVTQSIKDKATDGNIRVTANEDLIPAFDVSPETKLTNAELATITKQAQEQCQGGADTACMQSTRARLMQEKHAQKAQTDTSAANIIAGRSLQVTYMDSTNKVRRVVVPDGQKFELDNVGFVNKAGKVEGPSIWASMQEVFSGVLKRGWWTLLFVFSVAAAYRVFKIYGNVVLAMIIASLAVLLPLVGFSPQVGIYLIILVYGFLEMGKMSKEKAMAAFAAPSAPPFQYPGGVLPSAPSFEDPLAAFKGAAGSLNSVLGNLKGARANPMGVLEPLLSKR